MNNRDIFSEELGQVHERFEQWREQNGRRRRKIPEILWEAAANMAQTHGVNRVAKTLGLDYNQLKERSGKKTKPKNNQSGFPFVELMMPVAGTTQGKMIELINREGSRMIVRLNDNSGQELASLAGVFLRPSK